MDTKEAFEKWLKDEYIWGTEALEQCRWQPFGKGDGYYICNERYDFLHFMFVAWAASLSAIEIELPELAVDHDERLRVETSVEGAFNLGVIRSRQAITTHGIRIKGKTE